MTTSKTNTGREINVKSNKSLRTFTIRVEGSKYRTIQFSKKEFNELEYNTANDWQNFLNSTNDYFVVK